MSERKHRLVQRIAAAFLAKAKEQKLPLIAVDLDTLDMEAFHLQNNRLLSLWHQELAQELTPLLHRAASEIAGLSASQAAAEMDMEAAARCNAAAETAESFDRPETVCLTIGGKDIPYSAMQEALAQVLKPHFEQAIDLLRGKEGVILFCGQLASWHIVTYLFRRIYAGSNPFFDPTLPDEVFITTMDTDRLAAEGDALLARRAVWIGDCCEHHVALQLQTLSSGTLTLTEHVLAEHGQGEDALRAVNPVSCFASSGSVLHILLDGKEHLLPLPEGFVSGEGEMISIRILPEDPSSLSVSVTPDRTITIPLAKE